MSTYLDHNATTAPLPEVLEEMRPYLASAAANPSSLHGPGQEARSAVERARQAVGRLIGATRGDVVFTGSGTEALALAILGAMPRRGERRRLVTSTIEHGAVLDAAAMAEDGGAVRASFDPGPDGRLAGESLRSALTPETGLVCVQHANNETGAVHPVSTLASVAAESGAWVLVDAVQSAGKIALDAEGWGADLVAVAAHKLGGPPGVGALWVAPGVSLSPLIPGAQEGGRRGGTHNVAGIVGFGVAADHARGRMESAASRISELRDRLERGVSDFVPESLVTVSGEPRLPNTTHLTFPPQIGEDLVIALDLEGFAVSAGAACRSGSTEPSHVLRAMKMPDDRARTALRISLGTTTTKAEVDAFVTALGALARARLEIQVGGR